MRDISLILFVSLIASGTMLCSCGSRTSNTSDSLTVAATDSLPVDVSDVVKAVAADDSAGFSARVNYPLERPYPLPDIKDENEMKSYYPVLVDDSLKNVLSHSVPSEWSEEGWRGWTVKDGQYLWIDGDVYEVNYISAREKVLRDSLIRKEKESLPADLRSGWMPEWVMEDEKEGTVYRIDADSLMMASATDAVVDGGSYRLAVYNKGSDLRREPRKILRGKRKMEGSEGNVSYYFSEKPFNEPSDSVEYVLELYSQETGGPRLHHREKKHDVTDHDLRKIYWLDKVSK